MLLIGVIVLAPPVGHVAFPGSRGFGTVLVAAGLAIVAASAVRLGRALTALPDPKANSKLDTRGPYRYVRHPIYTGVLACAFGVALRNTSILAFALAVLLTVILTAKARFEEGLLTRRFADYPAYAARTPRFLPRVNRRER